MRVFLTGATGYIGSAIAERLVERGDTVIGLTRSDEAASTLRERGIQPISGNLDRPGDLTAICREADAVMHLGFQWGSDVTSTILAERAVVEAMVAGVAGRAVPFLFPAERPCWGTRVRQCSMRIRRSSPTRSPSDSIRNSWCCRRTTATAS